MAKRFIAIVPDGAAENRDLKQLLVKFKRTVAGRDQEVRWTPLDLWHVTLRFLGDRSASESKDWFYELSLPPRDIKLSLYGVGAFPDETAARILWIGIHQNQEFLDLQSQIDQQLVGKGIEPEERDFRPHLTLARFRNSSSVTDLVRLGGRKHFGEYSIKELVLFESVLQGNILKYVALARRSI